MKKLIGMLCICFLAFCVFLVGTTKEEKLTEEAVAVSLPTMKTTKAAPIPPATAVAETPVEQPQGALKGIVVVLDPGHGRERTGTIQHGMVEKELNLDLALRTKALLEKEEATVILTRNGDTNCMEQVTKDEDLACRVEVAKTHQAAVFVSIHANAGNTSAHGAETYYYTKQSEELATYMQQAYIHATNLKDRSVKTAPFRVLMGTDVPSVLLEVGFLSNTEEASLFTQDSFKDTAARGIAQGIINYIN